MTISALTSSTYTYPTRNTGQRPPAAPNPYESVASTLSMSASDIESSVMSGKSLNDLAATQGVSHDDLIAALKKGMPADAASRTDATQMLEKLASTQGLVGPGGAGGPQDAGGAQGGHRPPPTQATGATTGNLNADQQQMLNSLAQLLNTDSTSLGDQLSSGKSLSDILAGSNVTTDQLAGIIQQGFMVDATA